jgi:hypothetical protein
MTTDLFSVMRWHLAAGIRVLVWVRVGANRGRARDSQPWVKRLGADDFLSFMPSRHDDMPWVILIWNHHPSSSSSLVDGMRSSSSSLAKPYFSRIAVVRSDRSVRRCSCRFSRFFRVLTMPRVSPNIFLFRLRAFRRRHQHQHEQPTTRTTAPRTDPTMIHKVVAFTTNAKRRGCQQDGHSCDQLRHRDLHIWEMDVPRHVCCLHDEANAHGLPWQEFTQLWKLDELAANCAPQ